MAADPTVRPDGASPDAAAIAAHACVACGAAARWDPAKAALACPYCGTSVPAALGGGGVVVAEHDVVRILRAIPETGRDWGADRLALRCGRCGAISLFEAGRAAQRCEFCTAAAIAPIDATPRPIRPDAVLPFRVSEADAREAARRAAGRRASVTSVTGAYLPHWRLTCDLYVHWHAMANVGTKEHPDYSPIDGGFSEVDSHLVPATKGVSADVLAGIAPFPLDELRPYDPGFVAGWVVEQYQIDLVAAGDRLCATLSERAPWTYRKRCHVEIPERRYHGLMVTATAAVTAFHHVLLPVWVVQATRGGRPRRIVVNGATGQAWTESEWPRGCGVAAAVALALAAGLLWILS
jgi:hypothetical protein